MKSVNKEYMLSPETCDLVADSVSEFCDKSNVENKDAIIATALVIDLITDFSVTAFEVGVLPMTLIGVSSQMSLLDKDVFKERTLTCCRFFVQILSGLLFLSGIAKSGCSSSHAV